MSQSRSRKPPTVSGPARTRTTQGKASGDTANPQNPHNNHRSKSKTKIPKNMRDELENALVGLCDVWFEDIKPHLMRNNIKLHIHGAGAGDVRERLPAGATGCSHLDPGAALDRRQRQIASSAGCCSTQQTVSRAPFHKLQAPPCQFPATRQPQSPQSSPTQKSLTIRIPCFDNEDKKSSRKATPRRKSPSTNWKVPPLCRACSLPLHSQAHKSRTNSRNTLEMTRNVCDSQSRPPKHGLNNHVRNKSPSKSKIKRKQKKNKSTQTEPVYFPEFGWQQSTSLSRPKHGFTSFYPSQRKKSKHRKEKPLFQDDLIDIIGDKHDKRVKVLYKSPRIEEKPSIMYLVHSPKKIGSAKKTVPWR